MDMFVCISRDIITKGTLMRSRDTLCSLDRITHCKHIFIFTFFDFTAFELYLLYSILPFFSRNLQGSVERRQGINHARFYAFLKGLQQIPENLFTKLCIMVDDPRFITFIDKGLRRMSENSFRSVTSGKLNEDLQTSMEVNQILRLRQDLKFQLIYCPSDVSSEGMSYAKKLARDAADKATLDAKHSRTS